MVEEAVEDGRGRWHVADELGHYRNVCHIPNVDLDLRSFRAFYMARRALLTQELCRILSAVETDLPEEPDQMESLVTGDEAAFG